MKDQVMQQLGFVLNALNNVYVKGKANLANLSGSIAILEEVADVLNNAEIVEATSKWEKMLYGCPLETEYAKL